MGGSGGVIIYFGDLVKMLSTVAIYATPKWFKFALCHLRMTPYLGQNKFREKKRVQSNKSFSLGIIQK